MKKEKVHFSSQNKPPKGMERYRKYESVSQQHQVNKVKGKSGLNTCRSVKGR